MEEVCDGKEEDECCLLKDFIKIYDQFSGLFFSTMKTIADGVHDPSFNKLGKKILISLFFLFSFVRLMV